MEINKAQLFHPRKLEIVWHDTLEYLAISGDNFVERLVNQFSFSFHFPCYFAIHPPASGYQNTHVQLD